MRRVVVGMSLAIFVVAACSAPAASQPGWSFTPAGPEASVAAARTVTVFKSPTCGCCHEWEAYLRAHGYTVVSMPTDDLTAIKAEHGVPQAAWSCHTAIIDGYVVEGHVPIEAIDDLLAEHPPIDGIALPGMPAGSPGMPGVKAAPFEILAIEAGTTSTFGSY
jgi:hypothetical protein